jgi:hypothetical protein
MLKPEAGARAHSLEGTQSLRRSAGQLREHQVSLRHFVTGHAACVSDVDIHPQITSGFQGGSGEFCIAIGEL